MKERPRGLRPPCGSAEPSPGSNVMSNRASQDAPDRSVQGCANASETRDHSGPLWAAQRDSRPYYSGVGCERLRFSAVSYLRVDGSIPSRLTIFSSALSDGAK